MSKLLVIVWDEKKSSKFDWVPLIYKRIVLGGKQHYFHIPLNRNFELVEHKNVICVQKVAPLEQGQGLSKFFCFGNLQIYVLK